MRKTEYIYQHQDCIKHFSKASFNYTYCLERYKGQTPMYNSYNSTTFDKYETLFRFRVFYSDMVLFSCKEYTSKYTHLYTNVL